MTDDDNVGHVAFERCCTCLRMRMLWHDNDWCRSLPCVNVASICGVL
jgi:hypothetical protein